MYFILFFYMLDRYKFIILLFCCNSNYLSCGITSPSRLFDYMEKVLFHSFVLYYRAQAQHTCDNTNIHARRSCWECAFCLYHEICRVLCCVAVCFAGSCFLGARTQPRDQTFFASLFTLLPTVSLM